MKHFLLILIFIVLTNLQSFAQCTADAGPVSTNVCSGSNIPLSGTIGGGATGGLWSSSGTGTFAPDATTLNATYTPSAADIASGSILISLQATGCSAYDSIIVNITPAPTANAGLDQTICAGSNVTLNGTVTVASGGMWTTSGSGTFNPSTTTLNATYIPSMADQTNGSVALTLTSTGNGSCNAVMDLVNINITPAPTAFAGDSIFACGSSGITIAGSITVASGGIWSTTNGTGTFSPSNTSLNAIYNPSAADISNGHVNIVLTTTGNGSCNTSTSQNIITFIATPTVNAGPDQSICSNNTASLNGTVTGANGAVWSTNGTGTFSPTTNSLNATYLPSFSDQVNGSVALTLTSTGNGSCNAITDLVTINYLPAPTSNAGPNQSMIAGGVTLAGSITVASGALWTTSGTGTFANASALNTTYTPSAADLTKGFVTLTLTTTGNGACSPATSKLVLTSNAEVCNVSITTTVTDNKIVFKASNDDGTSVGSYLWNFGDGLSSGERTQTHVYSTAGTYNVTLFYSTPDSSCTATKNTVVTIASAAIPTYSISGIIKAGANNLDKGLVVLFRLNNTTYDFIQSIQLTSANNGAYNFSNLDNGTYLLSTFIDPNSSYFFNYIAAYFGDVDKWNNARVLVVNNGNLTSKNINLIAYTTSDATWNTGNDSIKGVLTFDASVAFRTTATSTENPSANALIKLYNSNNELLTSTYTDAFGNYSFGNLIGGSYKITVDYAGGSTPSDLSVTTNGNGTIMQANTVVLKETVTTGISKTSYHVLSLEMYPNPAASEINLSLPSEIYGVSTVYIYSSLGKIVHKETCTITSGKNISLEINSLTPGLYNVEILSGEKIFKGKFAKN